MPAVLSLHLFSRPVVMLYRLLSELMGNRLRDQRVNPRLPIYVVALHMTLYCQDDGSLPDGGNQYQNTQLLGNANPITGDRQIQKY